LDEVHSNAAPARRAAEHHHHRGAAVIRIAAIRAKAHHKNNWDLGVILTSADAQFPGKKTSTSPSRRFSQLGHLLARIA
jgi:hypothetical protein